MSEELVLECFEHMHNSTHEVRQATETIETIIDDPGAISVFISIATSSTQSYIRNYCYVFIRKMIIKHNFMTYQEIDQDFSNNLRGFLFNRIQIETDGENICSIGEILNCVSLYTYREQSWSEFTQFAFELIAKNTLQSQYGYSLLKLTYENIPFQERDELIESLVNILISGFSSPTEMIRIKALQLFQKIAHNIDDPDDFQNYPAFQEALTQEYFSCLKQKKSNQECIAVFDSLEKLMNPHFEYFCQFTGTWLSMALESLTDEGLDVEVRSLLTSFIQAALKLELESGQEIDTGEITEAVFALIIEYVSRGDSENQWGIFGGIIELLAESVGIDTFIPGVFTLANDAGDAGIYAAIFILEEVIPVYGEAVSPVVDSIYEIASTCMQSEDHSIVDLASEVMDELFHFCLPSIIPYYDNIIELFSGHLDNFTAVISLDSILMMCRKVTPLAAELLQLIFMATEEAQSDMKLMQNLILLASSTIQILPSVSDTFEEIFNWVSEFMSDPDCIAPIMMLLASLAIKAESIPDENLASIFELIKVAITSSDPEYELSGIKALIKIARKMGSNLLPLFPDLPCDLIPIIQPEREGNQYQSSGQMEPKGWAAQCFALFSFISSELLQSFPEYPEILISWLESDEDILHKFAAFSFLELVNLLPMQEFVEHFMNDAVDNRAPCATSYELDCVAEAIKADHSIALSQQTAEFFIAIFDIITSIDQAENAEQRKEIINSLFKSLRVFIQTAGTALVPSFNEFTAKLVNVSQNGATANMQGGALIALAAFVVSVEDSEELRNLLAEMCKMYFETNNVVLHIAAFDVLRMLSLPADEHIERARTVIAAGNPITSMHAAAYLLQIGQITAKELEGISFSSDVIVDATRAAVATGKLTPGIAVQAASLDNYVWALLEDDHDTIVGVVSALGLDAISSMVNGNKIKIDLIATHCSLSD